jgi:hypothetical protein
MKTTLARILATATSAFLLVAPMNAAEKAVTGSSPAPAQESRSTQRSTYPFRGEVESVDGSQVLLSKKDGTRKVEIGSETLLERDGKAISSTEVKPGDYLRGLVRKNEGGAEVVVKASAGTKPEKKSTKSNRKAS